MRLINADALMRDIEKYHLSDGKFQHWVEVQPTIEERKTGNWTSENACEFCGFQPWFERDIHTLSFCPNCGAGLRGGNNETIENTD